MHVVSILNDSKGMDSYGWYLEKEVKHPQQTVKPIFISNSLTNLLRKTNTSNQTVELRNFLEHEHEKEDDERIFGW